MTIAPNPTPASSPGVNEFGFNGTHTAGYTFTINSVIATNRPAIRLVNANATIGGSKTLAGWVPIRIESTDYYFPIYS